MALALFSICTNSESWISSPSSANRFSWSAALCCLDDYLVYYRAWSCFGTTSAVEICGLCLEMDIVLRMIIDSCGSSTARDRSEPVPRLGEAWPPPCFYEAFLGLCAGNFGLSDASPKLGTRPKCWPLRAARVYPGPPNCEASDPSAASAAFLLFVRPD